MSHTFQKLLDVSGLRCPMPLLKAKMALSSMESGEVLKVVATDGGSWRDIPAFVEISQHQLLEKQKLEQEFIFYIVKGE